MQNEKKNEMLYSYIPLTKRVRGPSFFALICAWAINQREKLLSVAYSSDRENEVSERHVGILIKTERNISTLFSFPHRRSTTFSLEADPVY